MSEIEAGIHRMSVTLHMMSNVSDAARTLMYEVDPGKQYIEFLNLWMNFDPVYIFLTGNSFSLDVWFCR